MFEKQIVIIIEQCKLDILLNDTWISKN